MSQLTFLEEKDKKLINLKEASEWASQYLHRNVTISNISYLLQYGRIMRYGNNGNPLLNVEELKDYYDSLNKEKRLKKYWVKTLIGIYPLWNTKKRKGRNMFIGCTLTKESLFLNW